MDRKAIRHLGSINREEKRKGKKIVTNKLRPGITFYTGTGSPNQAVTVTTDTVCIVSSRNTLIEFNLDSITMASAYLYRVRQVERRQLEVFHKYTSTLFAILKYIFKDITKILHQKKRALRLVLIGVRFFLAGGERSPRDLKIAAEQGAKYVLFSYYHLRYDTAWLKHAEKLGLRILLDSGAFSVYQQKLKGKQVNDITLDEYMNFIKKHEHMLEGYFTLDVIGDYKKTKENLKIMENMGLTPIPVFHMGVPLEELEELVEKGYPVIGLGGTVNKPWYKKVRFLSRVFENFPNQLFHGLGISTLKLINMTATITAR